MFPYYTITASNLRISCSYLFPKHEMRGVLIDLRKRHPDAGVWSRPLGSLVAEWKAHNVAYLFGIMRDRTGDVDLDAGEPWWRRLAYWTAAILFGWLLK